MHDDVIVAMFSTKRVLIFGDLMLDCYIQGDVDRISPEAPVPVVRVTSTHYAPGGAANVAVNVASLGAKTALLGVVDESRQLPEMLRASGVETCWLQRDPHYVTPLKTRIIAHRQHLLRVDNETQLSPSPRTLEAMVQQAAEIIPEVDALIVSDYAKGVVVPQVLRKLIDLARAHDKPVVVDPKGYDYSKYAGATAITPNRHEMAQLMRESPRDDTLLPKAAKRLIAELGCKLVLVTRGEEGMTLFQHDGREFSLPAQSQAVNNVTGAGDTVVAVFTLALTAGASFLEAAKLANRAAGDVVKKFGTAAVSASELICEASGSTPITAVRRYTESA